LPQCQELVGKRTMVEKASLILNPNLGLTKQSRFFYTRTRTGDHRIIRYAMD